LAVGVTPDVDDRDFPLGGVGMAEVSAIERALRTEVGELRARVAERDAIVVLTEFEPAR